jgi:hypothetical protein
MKLNNKNMFFLTESKKRHKKLKTYSNYSIYERDCPLLNASLFTLSFCIVLKSRVVKKSQTSVKSKALRRGQALSYTE